MKKENKIKREIVRSEVNLEKWQIFTTRKYKGKSREIIRRESDKEYKVIIGKTEQNEAGVLTAEDGKVFYALLKKWEDAGRPEDRPILFSLRSLCKELKENQSASSRDLELIKKHLFNLALVPIKFVESYKVPGGKNTITTVFSLLGQLRIFERSRDNPDQLYFCFSEFKLHDEIIKGIKQKNIKPVRVDVLRQLQSDIAFILYRYLDLILSDKTQYERDIEDLAVELSFGAKRLDNLIRQVKDACKELQGKEITTGRITYCGVEKTVDGKRWKLVVRKGRQVKLESGGGSVDEPAGTTKPVVVKYKGQGSSVKIAGSFNNWEAEEMAKFGENWSILLELAPGKYQYKLIVDGEWILDPENPEKVTDEQGNENSVLIINEGGNE